MKRTLFGAVGTLAVVVLFASCVSDPTASLRTGVVDRVAISRTYMELDVGGELTLTAQAYDEQGNALPDLPTISSSDPAVVSVEVDDEVSGDPQPLTSFKITAVTAGSATLTATAGSVNSNPSTVVSFPLVFDGSVTVDQSGPQDIVTVAGTSTLSFDDQTTVIIGGVEAAPLSTAADQIQVAVVNEDALSGGSVRVNNMLFLGSSRSSLDAVSTVDTRGAPFGSSVGAAGDITAGPFPLTLYLRIDHDNSPDWFAKFDTPTDLPVTVTVNWTTGDDLDILWYDTTGACCYFNFDGAGSSIPEVSSATIPGGFPILLNVNSFAGGVSFVQVDITSP